MNQKIYADSSRWEAKIGAIRKAVSAKLLIEIKLVVDMVMNDVRINVTGQRYQFVSRIAEFGPRKGQSIQVPLPNPDAGTMPIPRLTGQLSRAPHLERKSKYVWAIRIRSDVAAHAEDVHDNPDNPRKFLADAVEKHEPDMQKVDKEIKDVIRSIGRQEHGYL